MKNVLQAPAGRLSTPDLFYFDDFLWETMTETYSLTK